LQKRMTCYRNIKTYCEFWQKGQIGVPLDWLDLHSYAQNHSSMVLLKASDCQASNECLHAQIQYRLIQMLEYTDTIYIQECSLGPCNCLVLQLRSHQSVVSLHNRLVFRWVALARTFRHDLNDGIDIRTYKIRYGVSRSGHSFRACEAIWSWR